MRTALYRHYDKNGLLLYVGVSLNAASRFGAHIRCSAWAYKSKKMTIEWFETRADALRAEKNAIIKENPAHNINHNKRLRLSKTKRSFVSGKHTHDWVAGFSPEAHPLLSRYWRIWPLTKGECKLFYSWIGGRNKPWNPIHLHAWKYFAYQWWKGWGVIGSLLITFFFFI